MAARDVVLPTRSALGRWPRLPSQVIGGSMALCTWGLLQPVTVHAQPGLAGSPTSDWTASALKEQWSFPRWEQECGPRPAPQSLGGGPAQVTEKDGQLTISGSGRTYRTTECWERYPGLGRVAHSSATRTWSNTCRTAESDPRRALVQTSVTATDTTITLRETGQYAFRLKDANCEARVVRTRTWSKKAAEARETATSPAVPSADSRPAEDVNGSGAPETRAATQGQSPPSASPATPACDDVGPPSSIEVQQRALELGPGQSVRLLPQVVDEAGCRVQNAELRFTVTPKDKGVVVDERDGTVKVALQASEGAYAITIQSGALSTSVGLKLLSPEQAAAALRTPALGVPLTDGQAKPQGTMMQVGAAAAQGEDAATPRKWVFAALASLVVVGLGILGLRLLRGAPRPARLSPNGAVSLRGGAITVRSAEGTSALTNDRAEGTGGVARSPASIAHARTAAWSEGAPDATPLPAARRGRVSTPPPKPSSKPPPQRRSGAGVCPACGTRYTDGSIYCGMDGVRLSPDED